MLEEMVPWQTAEWREPASSDRLPVHRSESPTGYSSAGCSPAEPASASPVTDNNSSIPIRRLAVIPYRAGRARRQPGCHLYFARRVTFLSCADKLRVDRILEPRSQTGHGGGRRRRLCRSGIPCAVSGRLYRTPAWMGSRRTSRLACHRVGIRVSFASAVASWRMSSITSAAPCCSRRAPCSNPQWLPPQKPIAVIPAPQAASMPAGLSSMTRQRSGAAASRCAA
jgi:hypothetical protein